MARPLKPIFDQEEIKQIIQPTLDGALRMCTLEGSSKIKTSETGCLRAVLSAEFFILKLSHMKIAPGFGVIGKDSMMTIEAGPDLLQLGVIWRELDTIFKGWLNGRETGPRRQVMPRFLAFYEAFDLLMSLYSNILKIGGEGVYLEQCFIDEFEGLLVSGFEQFQAEVRSETVATKTKRLQTRINRNRLQQRKYLDELLDSYGSLYTVYLDLGYSIMSADFFRRHSYDQIRGDFDKFMKERRHNPLWKHDLVGFIWKLSDGVQRGYHYHLILFYRGESAGQHLQDKKILLQKWINDITGGRGAGFEPISQGGEENKFFVPKGVISREDENSYEWAVRFIHYLNKLDYLIHLDVPKGGNVYGRGHI